MELHSARAKIIEALGDEEDLWIEVHLGILIVSSIFLITANSILISIGAGIFFFVIANPILESVIEKVALKIREIS